MIKRLKKDGRIWYLFQGIGLERFSENI
jgi:hypothetical protein